MTQRDVARAAGVSTAVVSAVLSPKKNSSIRVAPETAQRVHDAVQRLGYVPNLVARSLAGGERRLLGVFTYEPVFPSDRANFFYPFLLGIERGVERAGYDLLLFTSRGDEAKGDTAEGRKIYPSGANRLRLADGAILFGQEPDKSELTRLVAEEFPFVTIGRREISAGQISYIAADYASATRDMVAHCAGLGHARIAYLGEKDPREQHLDREHGYWAGLEAAGLVQRHDWLLRLAPGDLDAARMSRLRAEGVTAILTESAAHAEAAEAVLKGLGLSVPKDLSIGVLAAPMEDRPEFRRWTRIRIPREKMGEAAVGALLDLLAGRAASPVQRVLPCTLEPSETVQPPAI
ncbi:LacI family DNA-binding transcriptional regulator [Pseudoroseicyclus sp. CXY001]|uniref:LacI family DNA-binding transcriptional regulator n=1 Tax=Pseudoroseicyclus sp. CXY001 TaxID=3242492 RepID=UPI00358DAECB